MQSSKPSIQATLGAAIITDPVRVQRATLILVEWLLSDEAAKQREQQTQASTVQGAKTNAG